MRSKIFQGVAGNAPRLNRFDLSYTNTFSADFGFLYPVQCDECTPGDVFKMSAYCHAELMPLVAPVMSDIQLYAHTFFVPYRLIYGVDPMDGKDLWEKFITGGEDGEYDTPLPGWFPSWSVVGFSSKKIWDYVGNPVFFNSSTQTWTPLVPDGLDVSIAPKRAYNLIFNEFYRDERLVDEVDQDSEDLQRVSFRKDYFTSALESQQLGTAPAFPMAYTYDDPTIQPVSTGTGHFGYETYMAPAGTGQSSIYSPRFDVDGFAPLVSFYSKVTEQSSGRQSTGYDVWRSSDFPVVSGDFSRNGEDYHYDVNTNGPVFSSDDSITSVRGEPVIPNSSDLTHYINHGSNVNGNNYLLGVNIPSYKVSPLNLQISSGFDVSDLRLAFAIQRMQELSMRAGTRYTEWLSAHYNAHPTDARLNRPEYIGGAVYNVTVSPVMQSSGTEDSQGPQVSPQGTKVGIGQIDSVEKLGNYRVLEHGLIMTLISIRPKPIYQQGINRQWLRQVKEDYYIPELAYLSEQGVYNAELFVDGSDDDKDIFGYQARWNEMRCKNNLVSGAVREQLSYWTLARKFSTRPALNSDFITIDNKDFNKIFAVQDEDPFVISWSNIIDGYRPLPAMGVPGLIDHVYGERY